jgi:hypothetical protein
MAEDPRLDRLIQGSRAFHAPNENERKNDTRMGWLNTPEEAALIDRAAEARDISRNAFLRRAAVAMAAHILGLDYYDVMEGAPVVRTFHKYDREGLGGTVFTQHRNIPGSEGGKGCGPWKITGLTDSSQS